MKVGLIVEGSSDVNAIKVLCRKIGITAKIRKQRGKINVRKACSYAKELISQDCKKVIILPDSHCNKEGEKSELREFLNFVKNLRVKSIYV